MVVAESGSNMIVKYDFVVSPDYKLMKNETMNDGNIVTRTVHNVHHINIGQHSFTYFLETGYTKTNHPYYSFSVNFCGVMNVRVYENDD